MLGSKFHDSLSGYESCFKIATNHSSVSLCNAFSQEAVVCCTPVSVCSNLWYRLATPGTAHSAVYLDGYIRQVSSPCPHGNVFIENSIFRRRLRVDRYHFHMKTQSSQDRSRLVFQKIRTFIVFAVRMST